MKEWISILKQAPLWPLQVWRILIFSLPVMVLASCATWQPPGDAGDDSTLRQRAVTARVDDVRLNAAVLDAEESLRMLGANVIKRGVQPVWIEVENNTSQTLWLLRSGTDPDYFSPLEVAWSFHSFLADGNNARLDDHFDALGFQNPIAPGAIQSGIIFTNPHQQTKLLNIDLLGHGRVIPFTLFPPVPDDASDETAVNIAQRFADTGSVDYREGGRLRAALEKMPCCATGTDTENRRDPLNMVLVGEFADIAAALVRRNFRRVELDYDDTQQLFGRPPDVVVRKMVQDGMPANWLRMWVAPLHYLGQPVFLAQAGRAVGGRFSVSNGDDIVLHPNVDEARNIVIQDLLYSGGLAKLGFVTGVGTAGTAKPQDASLEAGYYTDGLRAVLFLETRPLALSDVQILDWEPALKRRENRAIKESKSTRLY